MFTIPAAALIPVKLDAAAAPFIVIPDTVLPCTDVADTTPTFKLIPVKAVAALVVKPAIVLLLTVEPDAVVAGV